MLVPGGFWTLNPGRSAHLSCSDVCPGLRAVVWAPPYSVLAQAWG